MQNPKANKKRFAVYLTGALVFVFLAFMTFRQFQSLRYNNIALEEQKDIALVFTRYVVSVAPPENTELHGTFATYGGLETKTESADYGAQIDFFISGEVTEADVLWYYKAEMSQGVQVEVTLLTEPTVQTWASVEDDVRAETEEVLQKKLSMGIPVYRVRITYHIQEVAPALIFTWTGEEEK